jgi:hypothetical protein
MMSNKEQKLIYTAYCKECDKEVSSGTDPDKAFKPALEHCKKHDHELVFGMAVYWIEDSKDKDVLEHVAFCKVCRKNIAAGTNKDVVLRMAMEHCENTKHELAYGVVVKNV